MRLRNVYLLFTFILAQGASVHGVAQEENAEMALENLEGINSQSLSFLSAHYDEQINDDATITIDVKPLDNRLRLMRCDKPLTFEVRDSGQVGGRVSVKARCQGSASWTIYVQASVGIETSITVAAENLVRGTVITDRHLKQVRVDTSRLRPGYATDRDSLIGKAASRNIQRDKPIRYSYIEDPIAIKRGDLIILEAIGSGISVATEGIAMESGSIGDRIQVKNQSSKQVVTGEIVGSGRVKAGHGSSSAGPRSPANREDSLADISH